MGQYNTIFNWNLNYKMRKFVLQCDQFQDDIQSMSYGFQVGVKTKDNVRNSVTTISLVSEKF